ELKAKLRQVMEDESRTKSEREVQQQLEEALVKSNQIPLPPSLIEAQVEHMLERLRAQILGPKGQWSDKQLDDLRQKLRPKAEAELRLSYLLPAIAEKEKIKALDEDIQAEFERNLSAAQDEDRKQEIQKMFKERRDAISDMIRDRKTMDWIREKATMVEG
ncbi:MAG: hypothetical protein HY549_05465, partial [Elusimicrobia bacterium]|nr:hypothetical protein [Elusimicrobiota bacterium]